MTTAKTSKPDQSTTDQTSMTAMLPRLEPAEFKPASSAADFEDTVAIDATANRAYPGLALVELDGLNHGFNPYDNHDRWLLQRLKENARKQKRSD